MNGIPVVGGTQWIAWTRLISSRSWSFYLGGVGEAVWAKSGGKWVSKGLARTADGKKVSATTSLTKTDPDRITWQLST